MQCECSSNQHCIWCKDIDHMNNSCMDGMSQSVRIGSYSVIMMCCCGNVLKLHPDYFYFFCETCGYFCVGCGRNSSESNHEVCQFMLKHYYLVRRVS